MSNQHSQDSYLRTGNANSIRVRGEGSNWWIEGTDNNNVWVDVDPSVRYSTQDDAEEAMETLAEFRRDRTEREFIEGFAAGAEIPYREARDAWAQFSRQMSDADREAEEQHGRFRGMALGIEYKAL